MDGASAWKADVSWAAVLANFQQIWAQNLQTVLPSNLQACEKNEMVQATVGTSVFPIITTTVAQWVSSDWLNCSLVFSFFGYSNLCFMSTVFCRPFANVIATQEERPTEKSRVGCLKQGHGEMYVIFGWWRCFCLGFMLGIFQCVTDQCFWSNVFLQVFCNVCRQLAFSVTLWWRGAYSSTWHKEIGY
jgi:hypothetical protein